MMNNDKDEDEAPRETPAESDHEVYARKAEIPPNAIADLIKELIPGFALIRLAMLENDVARLTNPPRHAPLWAHLIIALAWIGSAVGASYGFWGPLLFCTSAKATWYVGEMALRPYVRKRKRSKKPRTVESGNEPTVKGEING